MNITRHRPATVLALALLAAAAAHADQNQIYGIINPSVNTSKTGTVRQTYVDDNGSRLGFRGGEDTGGGLKGVYGLEMGYDASNGTPLAPFFRNSYVGLASSTWGTVAAGRLDIANPTGSPIYSLVSILRSLAPTDSGATATLVTYYNARNRVSNAIGYRSPDFGPFVFRARYYLRGATTAVDNENVTNQGRSLDLGLNYAAGPLRTGIAYGHDSRSGGLATNEMKHKWQTGVRYAFPNVEPYLLYGREYYVNTATTRDHVDYWTVGVKFYSGPHAVVVNHLQRQLQTSLTADKKKDQAAYMYALSKRTELQLFVDRDNADTTKVNVTKLTYGAGIKHTF